MHRIAVTLEGEPGLHRLCAGDRSLFRHIRKHLWAMTTMIENDLPVSTIWQAKDPSFITTCSRETP